MTTIGKNIIFLFLTSLLLSSCEHSYTYTYTVTNGTDTTISIYLKTYKTDTTFKLNKGEKKIIYSNSHGIEGSHGPYYRDVDKDLDEFTATKGQVVSKRDFRKNYSWLFEKGGYRTTIRQVDF